MTKERLKELGWEEGFYKKNSYMYKDELVLISYVDVWALGRLISGDPHIPEEHPVYVKNEQELNSLLK